MARRRRGPDVDDVEEPPPALTATLVVMQIVAALFVENFEMRQAPGPSTRIDITGAMFSMASVEPVPVEISPHLVALIHCPADATGTGVFEVIFRDHSDPDSSDDREPIARNVSPFTVEPGRFTYRLVRAELPFNDYGTMYAHCRVDRGPWTIVPFTLLPPAE